MPQPVVVITGPTATGKTALGVLLALQAGGEVVSADSMQIYRGMDIGTAKPAADEMRGVPHHMLDVADPTEDYSVARYVEEASRCADDILARGKLPVVVGGTGLYIDSLLAGRRFAAAPGDAELRRRLAAEYDEAGGAAFSERLRGLDPERAAKLHPADKRRLVRAMEVCLSGGETMTEHDRRDRERPPRYASVRFALCYAERQRLYDRIDARVDDMVSRGLFKEVRALLDGGLPPDSGAMQAIGYKEAAAALRGECSEDEAVELIKRGSRRYAKRQLTWLRRDGGLRWLLWEKEPSLSRLPEELLAALNSRDSFDGFR
jgi:tRNA dimethylallyltransferase